jgi:hypothetical protein
MTTHALTRNRRPPVTPAAGELADSLDHVRDLVRLRRIFTEYGATEEELRVCDTEIGQYRSRIASLARAGAKSLAA